MEGACKRLKIRSIFIYILVILLTLASSVAAFAAEAQPAARVVFKAGEPDANGVFIATLTVYNATFNAFQFAFSYSTDAVAPSDASGKIVSSFSGCAKAAAGTDSWMVSIGNKLDAEKGLLECGGYVKPGSGSITAGSSGMALYTFTFKKTGKGDAGIRLATKESGGPYNPSIKEGGGLAEAGYNVDARIEIVLPEAVGENATAEIVSPKQAPSETKPPAIPPGAQQARAARLENTVIMQIGNMAAAKGGALTKVDKDNTLVAPYIDVNGRTMVPIRFVAESLGALVEWNDEKQQVTVSHNSKVIVMTIGSKSFTINGAVKSMDTVPVINKGWGRTMVPMRFVGEALGMNVQWDELNRLVILSPLSNPWKLDGETEKDVTSNILLLFSPLMRDFV